MKKRVIFAFLFALVFIFSALAVPDLSECETEEDAYEMGYYDYLIETYDAMIAEPSISLREKYMLYGVINQLYQDNAFIEFSDFTPYGEYTLEDAYSEGRSSALVNFDELYKELNDEIENQPEPLTPEDAQDSYDEGYQAGYSDGKSRYEYTPDETKEESDEITDILTLCGLGCIIGIIIGYFIRKKVNRNILKPYNTPSKADYSSIRTAPAHSDFSEPLPKHTEPKSSRASVDLFTPVSVSARNPADRKSVV